MIVFIVKMNYQYKNKFIFRDVLFQPFLTLNSLSVITTYDIKCRKQ